MCLPSGGVHLSMKLCELRFCIPKHEIMCVLRFRTPKHEIMRVLRLHSSILLVSFKILSQKTINVLDNIAYTCSR